MCQEESLQQVFFQVWPIKWLCIKVLINAFPGDNLGIGGRLGEKGQFLESLRRSLEYCTSLDCHLLHIVAGRLLAFMCFFGRALQESIPGYVDLLDFFMMNVAHPLAELSHCYDYSPQFRLSN